LLSLENKTYYVGSGLFKAFHLVPRDAKRMTSALLTLCLPYQKTTLITEFMCTGIQTNLGLEIQFLSFNFVANIKDHSKDCILCLR